MWFPGGEALTGCLGDSPPILLRGTFQATLHCCLAAPLVGTFVPTALT